MRLRLLVKCVTGVCTAGIFAVAVSSMSVATAAPRTSESGHGRSRARRLHTTFVSTSR